MYASDHIVHSHISSIVPQMEQEYCVEARGQFEHLSDVHVSDMHLINQHFTLEYFGIGLSLKFLYAKTHLGGVLGRPRPQAPHAAAALKMRDGDAVHTRVPGTEEGRAV